MAGERGLEAADRAMRPPDRQDDGDASPLTASPLCAGLDKSGVLRLSAWSGVHLSAGRGDPRRRLDGGDFAVRGVR